MRWRDVLFCAAVMAVTFAGAVFAVLAVLP